MTLDHATRLIQTCVDQMNARYENVVFDEWAVLSIGNRKGRLLAYTGPRKRGFNENFVSDLGSLRAGLLSKDYATGDFNFSRQEVGTGYESFLVLGEGVFLICNNTVQSMDGITKDPRWLSAQVPFVELSEKVRSDPVTVSTA